MSVNRTIEHPGVEMREIDKSQYSPSIAGTYGLVAGFADKGTNYEPIILGDRNDLLSTFGKPTNDAERYFFYACDEIIKNGGTLVAAKIPYANAISNYFKGIGVSIGAVSGMALSAFESDSFSSSTSASLSAATTDGFYTSYAKVESEIVTFPNAEYDQIACGGSFSTNTSGYDFIVVDETKTVRSGYTDSEGLVVMFVDPIDALRVQRMFSTSTDTDAMDIVGSINNIDSTGFSLPLTATLNKSSYSENVMKQFPAIEWLDSGNAIDKTYSHHLGIVIGKTNESEKDGGKLVLSILEAFVGSIHSDSVNASTNQSNYLIDIVNAGSNYVKMYKNASSTIDTSLDDLDTVVLVHDDNIDCPLLAFDKSESVKKIKGGYIPSALDIIFEKVSNIDAIQIDFVEDAGLSTIAQMCYSALDYNAIIDCYVIDEGVLVEDGDALVIEGFGTDRGGIEFSPTMAQASALIDSSTDVEIWRSVCDAIESFCKDVRKDCMAILDSPRNLVLNGQVKHIRKTNPSATFGSVIGNRLKYITGINSSYAALYCNWMKMLDSYTGTMFWAPPTVKVGGVYCYNDQVANIWDAPAGLNRGVVNGIVDISFEPNDKAESQIYIKSINYMKHYPLDGFVVEGQKTTQIKPSAFDRVNVRRLFLRLERLVYKTVRYFVYEPNNMFTRRRLIDTIDPIFDSVKKAGGMYDYRLVCDDSNNTTTVIENNEMKVAVLIKPVKTAEFILCDFVATRTDADFSEILSEI